MDHNERSVRYLFWRQLFFSLTAVGLGYILFIRPLQFLVIDDIILPFFDTLIQPGSDILARPGRDEVFLLSVTNIFHEVQIEVPFNGYFWLAMAMIWPTKNKRSSRVIWVYNWLLFIIIPIAAMGILNGITWLAPIVNVHEKVYKALFLILGVLAVREADELLKD